MKRIKLIMIITILFFVGCYGTDPDDPNQGDDEGDVGDGEPDKEINDHNHPTNTFPENHEQEMCQVENTCPIPGPNPERFDDATCEIDTDPRNDNIVSPRLAHGLDCGESWKALSKKLGAQMERDVDQAMKGFLAVIKNRSNCYTTCKREIPCDDLWGYGDTDTDIDTDTDSDTDSDGDMDADYDDGASEYSETNTQVHGVDEADFLKNDASNFYVLADNRFQILDVWPPEEAQSISGLPIEGTVKRMYVHGDRALVYSSIGQVDTSDPAFWQAGGECTYGYDCDFVGDGQNLKMTLLDISDMTAPRVLRETVLNGSYISSRRIGDAVFTVLIYPEFPQPQLVMLPAALSPYHGTCSDDIPFSTCEIKELFAELKRDNHRLLEKLGAGAFLPNITDTRHRPSGSTSNTEALGSCNDLHISQAGDGTNQLAIVAFDMTKDETFNVSIVASRPGAVYADADSLYVAVRHYRNQTEGWYDNVANEVSTVHKFGLDPLTAESTYLASGVVKGRVLNQFAMDEHMGYLRIATTSGHVPNPDVHSTLSVLLEKDGRLETVGQLDNIAPTEDIRSVRFRDEEGFIVTFKKTDPLFAIDLSDPTAPSIEGELKIPGFSTYMHFLDDNHLLTIGFDAEDMGSFAWFQGIQLQIIDITNLENPTLLHKEIIGTRGSTSDAATDHMAFNYFAPKEMLAIPMIICEGSEGSGAYANKMTFSGLLVYKTTVADGFNLIGRIPHGDPELDYSNGSNCNNWWTQANSQVKRSVFMDDFVYSVAPDLINVSAVSDLEHPISSIDLINSD